MNTSVESNAQNNEPGLKAILCARSPSPYYKRYFIAGGHFASNHALKELAERADGNRHNFGATVTRSGPDAYVALRID